MTWHYVFPACGPTPQKPGENRASTLQNGNELLKMSMKEPSVGRITWNKGSRCHFSPNRPLSLEVGDILPCGA
jgi:hypothetical protein